ncbi:unnamed protein product [Nezara viridula]|uniref:Uncharacterized protein n=1 Tax=Nezara viridula TaxID=85310 RepID=A0A9P0ME71_NEZVI|nr:unnamed protein product [Nezara viridula]
MDGGEWGKGGHARALRQQAGGHLAFSPSTACSLPLRPLRPTNCASLPLHFVSGQRSCRSPLFSSSIYVFTDVK